MESLGRLVLSLGLIVGALLLVRHWAARGKRGLGGLSQSGLRVVSRTGLTRGSMVAVVETGGRMFLVGASDQGVRLLGELDPSTDDLDAAMAAQTGAAPARGVRQATGRSGATFPTDGGTTLAHARPWTGLLDRIRAMTVRTHVDRPIRVPLR
jgi:flagellar biogenesis protein FliO